MSNLIRNGVVMVDDVYFDRSKWTNKETWAVFQSLVVFKDQEGLEVDTVREIQATMASVRRMLSEQLRENAENAIDTIPEGIGVDVNKVRWYEIAGALMDPELYKLEPKAGDDD